MPGSTSGAFFTGFLAGSVLTASSAYVYLTTQNYVRARSKDDDDEDGQTTSSSRGLPLTNMTSSSAAAVVAHGERVGFLTDMMANLWPYIKEAGAASIKESVEPEFASLPGPLAKLHFTKVDLGTVPIRMDNVVMHKTDEKNNTLQFDLDVIWDGNCDIQLKGGLGVAFGVKSVKLQGRMSILLKPLTTDLSIVRGVQYSFINPPDLELDFTGLAQLADFSVVDKKIRGVLQDTMKSMIVLPERMLYKMDLACSFLDIYRPPLGVVCVTAVNGKGFVVEKRALRKDDIPDTYLNISMGGGSVVRSKTIKDSLTPVWNESFEFMMNDLDQIISIEAMDKDGGPLDPDDHLGTARATIGEIMLSGGYKELPLSHNLTSNGASVTLGCQVVNFTSDLSSLKENASANLLAGVLVILVIGAFDVPLKKEDAATFVTVEYKDKYFVTSAVVDYPGVDALNPAYDIAFHLPLSLSMVKDGKIEDIKFRLMNGEKTELGSMKVTHSEVAASPSNILTEKRAIGTGGASLQYRVALYGLDRSASNETTAPSVSQGVSTKKAAAVAPTMNLPRQGGATPSQMRVTAVSGHGFTIKKRGLKKADIPDCYCLIKVGSSASQWRTKTIKNNVSPVWKESKEYAFVNHGQTIQVDVWDANSGRFSKDDYVGSARATVGEFLLKGGSLEMELKAEGTPTGNYVVVKCECLLNH